MTSSVLGRNKFLIAADISFEFLGAILHVALQDLKIGSNVVSLMHFSPRILFLRLQSWYTECGNIEDSNGKTEKIDITFIIRLMLPLKPTLIKFVFF